MENEAGPQCYACTKENVWDNLLMLVKGIPSDNVISARRSLETNTLVWVSLFEAQRSCEDKQSHQRTLLGRKLG